MNLESTIGQRQGSFKKDIIPVRSTHIADELEKSLTFAGFEDIIVITNSPKSSMRLGAEGIKNYCTGGLLLNHSVAYVGADAEKFVSNINADKFFFSSRGYTENGVISDSSVEEAAIKRAMMKNSARTFYLCDSSKAGKKYMYNICTADDVDAIITEG